MHGQQHIKTILTVGIMYNCTRGKDIYRNKEKLGILRGAFVEDRIPKIN